MMESRTLRFVEATQRTSNGGSPLSNETAQYMDIGHGEPLLILAKRDLVALLLPFKDDPRVKRYLEEWNIFVDPVLTEEIV